MRIFRKLVTKFLVPDMQNSYAQFGEDLIIGHLFYQLGITNPTYLDIGANEARFISNTYLFYQRGGHGVLVEPNPYLYKKLKGARPRDTVIHAGIGLNEMTEADFYVFPDSANGLSTFSEKEARHWEITGMKGLGKIAVEKVIKVPLIPVNKVLDKYFADAAPNFMSIDVEGLDLEILMSMNFEKYRPELICVETLGYDEHQNSYKITAIAEYMEKVNYEVYADTRVNTIFRNKDISK